VFICLLIYLGLQIAFIGALSPSQLSKGWGALSFPGDIGPFAGLAIALGMPLLAKLLYADAVISPAGAGLVYMTSTARILYAMSEIGYIPACFKKLNTHGLPVVAIFFNFSLGMLLFLPLKGWQSLVGFLVSGMVISYAMGPITLICFRAELPNKLRTFKLPFAKLGCFLAFYFCNLLCYWTGWDTLLKFAVAILFGLICFFIYNLKNNKSADIKSSIWLMPYLLGLVLISYFGSFGGKKTIPFGWDFLIIGLFSIFILCIAYFCRIRNLEKNENVEKFIRGACVHLV
jgi:amino acid transporter